MKLVGTFAPSPALIASERPGVAVEVYRVDGEAVGYAFEVTGAFENAGAFVTGDGSPFATVEAALAAANDPEFPDVCEFPG